MKKNQSASSVFILSLYEQIRMMKWREKRGGETKKVCLVIDIFDWWISFLLFTLLLISSASIHLTGSKPRRKKNRVGVSRKERAKRDRQIVGLFFSLDICHRFLSEGWTIDRKKKTTDETFWWNIVGHKPYLISFVYAWINVYIERGRQKQSRERKRKEREKIPKSYIERWLIFGYAHCTKKKSNVIIDRMHVDDKSTYF